MEIIVITFLCWLAIWVVMQISWVIFMATRKTELMGRQKEDEFLEDFEVKVSHILPSHWLKCYRKY